MVMRKIIIAASVLGTAAAGVFWYMKNRQRADQALNDVKDAARNAYHKLNHKAKKDEHPGAGISCLNAFTSQLPYIFKRLPVIG